MRNIAINDVCDLRPGFYYVSAIYRGKAVRVSGPYPSHREAIEAEPDKSHEARRKFECCPFDTKWGTCRSEIDLGPGILES